jgi:hypothetical protein
MDKICKIEVLKDGGFYKVRAHLNQDASKEYRHSDFEEVLTEMVIDLQDVLEDKN